MSLLTRKQIIGFAAGLGLAAAAGLAAALGETETGPRDGTVTRPAVSTTRNSVLTVTATVPRLEDWTQTLPASGALAAWQEAVIGAETGNLRITQLFADVGTQVTRGQELARLAQDSVQADVRKQEALVAQARASLAQAQANAKRARLVKGSGALSDQQVTEYLITEETAKASLASAEADLDSSRITLARTSIRAVDDGVVTSRSATLGTVVSAGTELFRLQRQSRVEWQAELDARQVPQVRSGQTARVTLPDGRTVEGTVRQAAPALNSGTGRGIVYVALPAGSGALAGGYASGSIELGNSPALTLPQSAVVLRDGRSQVFTIGENGRVTRQIVATGRRQGDRVEILSGLSADAQVVETGGAFLSDGATVTVAPPPSADVGHGPTDVATLPAAVTGGR
ncbi:RND family efflux transporter MFP subunit [Azospirillum lipoferum]|uniref:efflux RND transporter periplasmic adaptor subunit n=1 Tax=Azospirillum TaxID=191 RepID=UPI001FEAD15A|nr:MULTISPECIES: efflux RND transporter periplasmic adaptor subunit [Azospirillum]MCP1610976.1 RND family efflux transporter MFP subunit [Azospirillum lipoferum]MDW5533891.1 efflux RND transporter periplasmic adaptor subunit [Azospirillum sp. NL1]